MLSEGFLLTQLFGRLVLRLEVGIRKLDEGAALTAFKSFTVDSNLYRFRAVPALHY